MKPTLETMTLTSASFEDLMKEILVRRVRETVEHEREAEEELGVLLQLLKR